ncbi:MAG TPA: CPBP family intramembrane glutamic endopeptidase, partial [Candidatus Saccharimonadales bacterium]|nr:CPBP family intramembrane glutamic endopeptidase [Candidatus Saccharimonadales bacterium]
TDAFIMLGYSQNSASFIGDAALGFSFPISVLLYFKAYMKMGNGEIVDSLGLGRKGLSAFTIGLGLLIFVIMMVISLGAGLLQNIINVPINTNVDLVLAGAPLWFYVFAAIIEPINEEVLFRGFMVPRIGIVASSLIFGILHATYDSTFAIEVIAAIVFGLLSGYVYRKTGSLYPSMIAHILVNSIAIIALIP